MSTLFVFFFFSSRRRHTRLQGDWSSDVCSSDLVRGDVIVSLAGIVVNLILFLVFGGLFAVVGLVAERVPSLTASLEILQRMMFYGMRLNLVLAFFNLIPIPPLDGSHVFYHLLPPGWGLKFRQFFHIGMLPLVLLSWL